MLVTFVRHGQSQANAGLTRDPDSILTPIGKEQAKATALRLRSEGFAPSKRSRIFVSPLKRALMTSQPLQEHTGVRAELFPDVCEFLAIDNEILAGFCGLPLVQIERQFPFVSIDPHAVGYDRWWPERETDEALYERAVRVREALLSDYLHPQAHVLIVSHADPICRFIEAFLRVPWGGSGPLWVDNSSITRVRVGQANEPAELVLYNDTSHLEALGISTPA